MSENHTPIRLRIPGTPVEAVVPEVPEEIKDQITIKEVRAFQISASRAGTAETPIIESLADDVVEIELEDGIRFWTTQERLRTEVLGLVRTRAVDEVADLPTTFDRRSAARGIVGKIVIKGLKFFRIDVAEKAAHFIAGRLEKHLLGKEEDGRGPGLYRILPGDELRLEPVSGGIPTLPADRPALLFLHGTASSTAGSFGKLWTDRRTSERNQLLAPYEGRIFGLEHETLTKSPIHNTIALAERLPASALLHLISHSRGGMVGELLCRTVITGGRDPFDAGDLSFFGEHNPGKIRGDLERLNALLKEKQFRIARFVRVACPARGTTLASERFDIYLSILFNLLSKAPLMSGAPAVKVAFDIFSELIMAVAKERSDATVLPGIEAMIPSSPLVAILNRTKDPVEGELRVIAGDIEGDNVLSAIGTLLTDPLYQDDHDLVVNTDAMFGGAERAGGAAFLFRRGPDVNHFSYFENADSAEGLARTLSRSGSEADGFEPFSVLATDSGIPPYEKRDTANRPVVFVLPGIMGSHLAINENRIWLDPFDIMRGKFELLSYGTPNLVKAEAPISMFYGDLARHLSKDYRVEPFPFDWRLSIFEEAKRLADAITKALDDTEKNRQPVSIVAHSMGGLVARAMISACPEVWDRMKERTGGRIIMLGTPNGGSHAVTQTLTGRDSLIRKLSLLDVTRKQQDLIAIVARFPGLLEMLPISSSLDLFDGESWKNLAKADPERETWQVPGSADLATARANRERLTQTPIDPERTFYIAGWAPVTPIDLTIDEDGEKKRLVFQATPRGDGRVPWETGIPAGVKTWYLKAAHGDLASEEEGFGAITDLLRHGTTDRLPTVAPETRGLPERSEITVERAPLYPDFKDLARTAVGSGRTTKKRRHTERKIRVSIRHGNLAFASHPVLVGHYKGDTIISAEAYLDRTLDNRLSARHRFRLYPGDNDTAEVFLNTEWEQSRKGDGKPPGAIVIGLGQVGELSPGRLMRAVSRGVRSYSLARSEIPQVKNGSAGPPGISALLVGTGAGGIAVQDAVNAILRGIIDAHGFMDEADRITEVEFIELYEDRAIQAARTLARLRDDPEISHAFAIDGELLVSSLDGGMRRANFFEEDPWWQRLQITEDKEERLSFNLLTDRARAKVYLQQSQRSLADKFIEEMSGSTESNKEVAVTLYEMLVPNELKEYAPDRRDVVLVLNDAAARYPWEMMEERHRGDEGAPSEKPLAVQAGMVRQLIVEKFRDRVMMALGKRALVVGNPHTPFADLPGAESEAKEVVKALENAGYDPVRLIGADAKGTTILRDLFARDYQIIHLAGHGVYEFRPPAVCDACNRPIEGNPVTGMVIGENQFLTAAQIRQMRTVPQLVFVNCCHLGKINDPQPLRNLPPNLAANVATELIRMGVRAVVAAGWAVQDDAAALFAATFYREMLSGATFGNAVRDARKTAYNQFGEYNTWGAYQCYGDPDFILGKGEAAPRRQSTTIYYTALSEAIVDIGNVAASAKTAGEADVADRLNKLKKIEQSIPPPWLASGDLQAALGEAYGELKRFEDAIDHYHKAIADDKGLASIKTAEQLCNLQVRWATDLADIDRTAALKLIEEAESRLHGLINLFGDTAERHSLLGSAAKRRIVIARDPSEIRLAFTSLVEHYSMAYDPRKPAYYPLVNQLTAQTLAALIDEGTKLPSDFTVLLEETERLAGEEHRIKPDFWNTVTPVDRLLLEHLAAGDLQDYVEEIVAGYGKAKNIGSPRSFESVLDQLGFLEKVMTAAPKNAERERLMAALRDIRHGAEPAGRRGEGLLQHPREEAGPETEQPARRQRAAPPGGPLRGESPPTTGAEPPSEGPAWEMPYTVPQTAEETQPVELGASAPRQAKPGSEFTARFAAYEKERKEEVRDLLKKLSPSAEPILGIHECRWKRGTRVTVKLSGQGLAVDPPDQDFIWNGGWSILDFDVTVTKNAEEGTIPLKFDVAIEGIVVARLRLDLEITATPKKKAIATATGEPAKTAFASYSSKDRLRVLDRVDAIQISASIDVFQDCLDLNPGEEFKPRLDNEIRERDLFLLFWSKNASESKWVNWELETALKEKGEQALQLHPLDPGVKPPPGLEKLNIGSVVMWVRKGYEAVLAERETAKPK